jgi:hypothetical protein
MDPGRFKNAKHIFRCFKKMVLNIYICVSVYLLNFARNSIVVSHIKVVDAQK